MTADHREPKRAPCDPATWVEQHGDALLRYAMTRVCNAATAEELVQETFLSALKGQSRFAGRSSERTWLIGILRRKVVDHFRRAASAEPLDETGGDEPGGGLFDHRGHWTYTVPRWRSEPDQTAEDSAFWKVFDECVGRLPPGAAGVFILRELEGLGTEEICKVLDITASNVWTQLHRARSSLRRCLESNWFAAP